MCIKNKNQDYLYLTSREVLKRLQKLKKKNFVSSYQYTFLFIRFTKLDTIVKSRYLNNYLSTQIHYHI